MISSELIPSFESFLELDQYFSEEYKYLRVTPDFKKIHIDHLKTNKQLTKLRKMCETSLNPYCNIILGLFEEYGLLETTWNYSKALDYYQKGANSNEPYCLYRLFYIYRNENEKFGLKKNAELQFSYLFKSAAYFDEKDNRFSDKVIDPILHLAVFYDGDKDKMDKLIALYLESLNYKDDLTSNFLQNWFNIKFPSSEDIKKTYIDKQKILAESFPEAAYHIGDNHRWGGETLEKDSIEAEKYLSLAAKHNLPKAIESLAIIYIEENDYEKATFWLDKGANLGSYLCIKFLGEYEISGKILPKNLEEGLKKLKLAFYIGDFWAAWTIIIVYKYIKNLHDELRNKKIFKYSSVLFSSKDIMGNIVYITIRHSSLATCYEKAICLEKDLKKALNLHIDCLSEIKRECWKGYTYYKIGKLYEKMNNKTKADDFYYKGFKARSDFIKKEHKKEPPHYYNYAKMFEFGRGVIKNLELAQRYYKLGADFNSFLSFHLVYGEKCKKRLLCIEKELSENHTILDYWPNFKKTNNKKINLIERKHFKCLERYEGSFKASGFALEMYNGVGVSDFNDINENIEQKLNKPIIAYKFCEIPYENYWLLVRNVFILDNYPDLLNKHPKILGIYLNNKAREMTIICSSEPKLTLLEGFLKNMKPSLEIKNKILSNILNLNYKSFINENNQLLCDKLTLSSFLINEKDNYQVYFNLPLLLNGEIEKNDENKLIHDLFNLVKEIMEGVKGKLGKNNENTDQLYKNLYLMINNQQKNWSFDDLHIQLNLPQKNSNKSKFFNF